MKDFFEENENKIEIQEHVENEIKLECTRCSKQTNKLYQYDVCKECALEFIKDDRIRNEMDRMDALRNETPILSTGGDPNYPVHPDADRIRVKNKINFCVTNNVLEKIIKIHHKTGKSKSEIVREILETHFEKV